MDRRLLKELPAVRRIVAVAAGLGMVQTASVVVQAVAVADLLASAMPSGARIDRLAALAWLAGGVSIRALAVAAGELVAGLGTAQVKAELRARLAASVLARAPDEGWRSPGDVAALAGRGLDALDVYVGRCLPDLFLAVAAPLVTAAVVGLLDWVSGVVVLVALALFPLFAVLVGRAAMDRAAVRWRQVERLARLVTDVFQGLPVLRALGLGAEQRARVASASEALRRASLATLTSAFLSALVLDTLASVSVALVAVPLGLRLVYGSIPLAPALAVLIVVPEVFVPLRRASAEFHESTEGLAAGAEALSILRGASAPAAGEPPGAFAPAPARVPLVLRDVTVALPGRAEPVLAGASLEIAPGETVALVGPNGSGKTTVVSLLAGFLAPSSGAVLAGGGDLAHLDLAAWRSGLAYLPDRPFLVAGSLADNLRLAAPRASDGELLDALAAAGAPGLAASLPGGLGTLLGDGGRALSAGERQRVALARILLRPAWLYLLDEPTEHLDRESELVAIEALRNRMAGSSALVVTHRPAALALADRVVELRDGRIAALGEDALARAVVAGRVA